MTSKCVGHGVLEHADRFDLQFLRALPKDSRSRPGIHKQKFQLFPKKINDFSNNMKLAISMSLSMITANYSLRMAPLSVYAIILSLKPILVIILGFFYGIENCSVQKLGFIFISFLGAALIINPGLFAHVYASVVGNTSEPTQSQKHYSLGKFQRNRN
jgi:hypothetical protein